MNPEPRLVEVRRNVLKQNDVVARALRARFRAAGVFVVSLVSSPGSGKTAFLEKTLTLLRPNYRVAALVGDLATENDALRLARSQAPVKQITTGTLCHLEAAMVEKALAEWDLNQLDFLFIENVGNLVCPSSYDLGEDLRLVLISVTRRGQAAEISHDFQQRRRGHRYQDRFGRRRGIQLGRGVWQHPGGTPGHARLQAFHENRRENGRISGIPGHPPG
jgi:hydrogenase accessory protein HypB